MRQLDFSLLRAYCIAWLSRLIVLMGAVHYSVVLKSLECSALLARA